MKLVVLILFLLGVPALAYAEPEYRLIEQTASYETRQYNDRVVVRALSGSSNNAFRKLFGYISGANSSQVKVAMTVPVSQSEKIDMTTPVTEQKANGSSYMSFYLPEKYTLETAPIPTDSAVELLIDSGGIFAVHRFSGSSSDSAFLKKSKLLRSALQDGGIAFVDQPIRATYNGPFTPGFMRRNEIMFRLK